jgi:hypothetical protein
MAKSEKTQALKRPKLLSLDEMLSMSPLERIADQVSRELYRKAKSGSTLPVLVQVEVEDLSKIGALVFSQCGEENLYFTTVQGDYSCYCKCL